MSRATYEGLRRLRPNERPFVLTRATFAAGQRYAAVWPGDNISSWSALADGISTLMGLGLSGFPFVGTDIGGFAGAASPELYTRWLQAAVFSPFMRSHTTFGTPPQDPWSYGSELERINRRSIELRYELLPQIYSVMREASVTGIPAMRPMFLEFPDDPRTYDLDTQFMFGDGLLVAPVVEEGARQRPVYLPKGAWYDYWTGERLEGGREITVDAPLSTLPIFVRSGHAVFRQPVVQHTGEINERTELTMVLYPAESGRAELYEDDGLSMAYEQGDYSVRRLEWSESATAVSVALNPVPEGKGRLRRLRTVIALRSERTPRSVTLSSATLSQLDERGWAGDGPGWRARGGFVEVRLPPGATDAQLTLTF